VREDEALPEVVETSTFEAEPHDFCPACLATCTSSARTPLSGSLRACASSTRQSRPVKPNWPELGVVRSTTNGCARGLL
jgi:hypothetical protein